jgi:hypothetical protein
VEKHDQVRPDLVDYARLIEDFVSGKITGPEFETAYLRLFKNDPVSHGESAFMILDRLFSDVDEYFDDPDSSEADRRQEEENLRACATKALEKLLGLERG